MALGSTGTHEMMNVFKGHRAFLLFFSVVLSLRLFFLFFSPLDLSPDEAYYWDWSRIPAWGYYSKPPMVAWIIGAFSSVFGATTEIVRLPAVLLGTLSMLPLYVLALEFTDRRGALLAAIVSTFTVGSSIASYIMTIDSPLLFFWTLACLFLVRAVKGHSPFYWILTGVIVGLGLLTKQTMVAFPAFALLALLLDKEARKKLFSPWPYLGVFFGVLIFLPTILWNMDHGWITLIHTEHHFDPNRGGIIEGIKTFLALFLSMFGILTPVTFFLCLRGSFDWARGLLCLEPGEKVLFCLGPLPFALVMILAFFQKVNANWPAPFFVTSLIIGVLWAIEKDARAFLKQAVIVGLTFTLIVYVSPFVVDRLAISGTRYDPFFRVKGWRTLGKEVHEALKGTKYPDDPAFILSYPRQNVSELAFYIPGHPRVYMWKRGEAIKSQYDLWPSPLQKWQGRNAIIVFPKEKRIGQGQRAGFEALRPLGEVVVPVGRHGKREYVLFYGVGARPL